MLKVLLTIELKIFRSFIIFSTTLIFFIQNKIGFSFSQECRVKASPIMTNAFHKSLILNQDTKINLFIFMKKIECAITKLLYN